ncbi:MAG: glycyl-radical enzyme activating protein [Syntrophales bacterium]
MKQVESKDGKSGWVFNIQRYSIQDGPGIRTTVFLKGCPLTCLWCSNPESQELHPQLLHFETQCTKCHKCLEACPNGAIIPGSNGEIVIDRKLCNACGVCVDACPSGAMVISGSLMTIDEVVAVVEKDSLFYRNSGGGVTFSGGEPTYQPAFLLGLLKSCQKKGFHTCLDTSACVQWEVFKKVLDYVDLVLFDVKHMSPDRHKELTGLDNQLILNNLRQIAKTGKEVIVRIPLMPDFNSSHENINALGDIMSQLSLKRVDLLPYHRLGMKKYEALGMEYKLTELRSFKKEEVEDIKGILENLGLKVEIV